MEHNIEKLRARELRVRDLVEPLVNASDYVVNRVHDETSPGWRDALIAPERPKPKRKPAKTAKKKRSSRR